MRAEPNGPSTPRGPPAPDAAGNAAVAAPRSSGARPRKRTAWPRAWARGWGYHRPRSGRVAARAEAALLHALEPAWDGVTIFFVRQRVGTR